MKKLIILCLLGGSLYGVGPGTYVLTTMPKSLSQQKMNTVSKSWKVRTPHDITTKMQSRPKPSWKVTLKEKVLEQKPNPECKVMLEGIDLDNDQSYMSSQGYYVEFDAPMKLYVMHGSRGNLEELDFEEKRLEVKVGNIKTPDFLKKTAVYKKTESYKNERRLSLIRKIKNHAATKALNTIQKGSLEKAWGTLCDMRKEVYGPDSAYGQPDFQPVENVSGPRITKYSVKNLHEAERIYLSRVDYTQMVKKQDLENQALEKAQQVEQQEFKALHVLENVHLDSEQRQPLLSLEKINFSNDTPYDFVQTTPTDVDAKALRIFQEKVTADPTTNFKSYIQQLNETLNVLEGQGFITGRTALFFARDFAKCSAQHVAYIANHPQEYAMEFVQAQIDLIDNLALLCGQPDIEFATPQEMQQWEMRVQEKVDSITQQFNQLCEAIPLMSREDWAKLSSRLFIDALVLKGVGKGVSALRNLPKHVKSSPFFDKLHSGLEQALAKHPEVVTAEGVVFKVPQAMEETNILKNASDKVKGGFDKAVKGVAEINQRSNAILRNGYYEVNGFKFSEYYYNKLWNKGRGAPSLIAKEILQDAKSVVLDIKKTGFFRYECGNWEMVYNPDTKEVWHLMPIKQK